MLASVRALLEGIIDYAGLFPPAKLPLDPALRNYLRYRQAPESWMLSRFIIPAARLAELHPFRDEAAPLRLSVLGRGGGTLREFLQGMADDLEAILAFHQDWGSQAVIEAFEMRLPDDLLQPEREKDLRTALAGPATILAQAGLPPLAAFAEILPGANWTTRFCRALTPMIEDVRRQLGFKLRTGGLEASAIPPVEEVAFMVMAGSLARVPLKFTAGLHHPLRRFDAGVPAKMHGFLNIFVAGVLAHARGLEEEQVRQIIEDEDAAHFRFDEEGLRWRDLRATTDEIRTARREAVTSFGSCSFDEPRDELRALGLLD